MILSRRVGGHVRGKTKQKRGNDNEAKSDGSLQPVTTKDARIYTVTNYSVSIRNIGRSVGEKIRYLRWREWGCSVHVMYV